MSDRLKFIPKPVWGVIPERPPGFYAMGGEEVICHRGHPVGRFTRDVRIGEAPGADDFQFADGSRPKEGEPLPHCHICGGVAFNVWVKGEHMTVQARFRDGWR